MIDDERLAELLRRARPPTRDTAAHRDVWPLLGERLDRKGRWSLIDAALGVAATVTVLLFPEWFWLLALHL